MESFDGQTDQMGDEDEFYTMQTVDQGVYDLLCRSEGYLQEVIIDLLSCWNRSFNSPHFFLFSLFAALQLLFTSLSAARPHCLPGLQTLRERFQDPHSRIHDRDI